MVLLHRRMKIKRMGDGVYTHIEINDLISAKIQTYSFGKLWFTLLVQTYDINQILAKMFKTLAIR